MDVFKRLSTSRLTALVVGRQFADVGDYTLGPSSGSPAVCKLQAGVVVVAAAGSGLQYAGAAAALRGCEGPAAAVQGCNGSQAALRDCAGSLRAWVTTARAAAVTSCGAAAVGHSSCGRRWTSAGSVCGGPGLGLGEKRILTAQRPSDGPQA